MTDNEFGEAIPNSPVSAQFVEQLVGCVPVGALAVDTSGIIHFYNQQLADILGYTSNELVGLPISVLLPEQFRGSHKSHVESFFSSPKKRQMGKGRDLYALCKNGQQIPIEIGLNPLPGNTHDWVLATLVDLTHRFHAARMFQRSVSVAPHGVIVTNKAGEILLVNQSLCQCFGYQDDELLGNKIEMLLPERYRQHHSGLRDGYQKDPTIRMMGKGRDLTGLHQDGREFPVEIGLSPFEDENGDKLVLVTLMDITDRKRMELELRETNKNLEEFTYVASHDLRSPLRGIADLLEWIKEDLGDDLDPAVDNNISRIDIRIKRMEQLIDNLLAYARAGNAAADYQQTSVTHMLNEITEFLSIPNTFTIEKHIELGEITTAIVPLNTILRNLISNAVKHHDSPETGHIVITAQEDGNYWHFSVCDNGPGIPQAACDRIFRLFQTVTSSERSGSGIGLSVSRRLAETHGGKISVELNGHQRGATFHLWWPRFIRKDTHD